jgi:hypothetical protein
VWSIPTGNLRSFVFYSRLVNKDRHTEAPLRWAINELKQMARTSRLKLVILLIDMRKIFQVEWELWKDLDGALKGSSDAHGNLEEVSLVLCLGNLTGFYVLTGSYLLSRSKCRCCWQRVV